MNSDTKRKLLKKSKEFLELSQHCSDKSLLCIIYMAMQYGYTAKTIDDDYQDELKKKFMPDYYR